jgi:hypothetical protein
MSFSLLRPVTAHARAAAAALTRLGGARVRSPLRAALLVVVGLSLAVGAAYGAYLLTVAEDELPYGVAPLTVGSRLPPLTGPCVNGPPSEGLPFPNGAVTVVDVWADW